jgi:hypothetical protein
LSLRWGVGTVPSLLVPLRRRQAAESLREWQAGVNLARVGQEHETVLAGGERQSGISRALNFSVAPVYAGRHMAHDRLLYFVVGIDRLIGITEAGTGNHAQTESTEQQQRDASPLHLFDSSPGRGTEIGPDIVCDTLNGTHGYTTTGPEEQLWGHAQ